MKNVRRQRKKESQKGRREKNYESWNGRRKGNFEIKIVTEIVTGTETGTDPAEETEIEIGIENGSGSGTARGRGREIATGNEKGRRNVGSVNVRKKRNEKREKENGKGETQDQYIALYNGALTCMKKVDRKLNNGQVLGISMKSQISIYDSYTTKLKK